MRLSKKISGLFAITSLAIILVYIFSSTIIVSYLDGGEVTRVSGVTNHSVGLVNAEIGKNISKGNEYASLMEVVAKYSSNLDIKDEVSMPEIKEKIENDEIDFTLVLDKNMKIEYENISKNISADYYKDFEKMKEALLVKIKNSKGNFKGIMAGELCPYIVSATPINNINTKEKLGYIVVVEPLSNEKIEKIGNGINRKLNLVDKIENGDEVVKSSSGDLDFTIVMKGQEVSSYYKLDMEQGDREYYIKLSDNSVVKSSTNESFVVISIVLIAITIGVNYILLMIINKMVVKRIDRINKDINQINESKNFIGGIEEDNINDEITVLTRDINNMFKSLDNASSLMVYKEKKYCELIDSLENGYGYFRIIYDRAKNPRDAYIEEVNDSLAKMLDRPKDAIIANTLKNIFLDKVVGDNDIESLLKSIIKAEGSLNKRSVRLNDKVWVDISVYAIEVGYFAMIVTDVTENKKYADKMKYLANYDVLTKLQNRYSIYKYMSKLKECGQGFNIFFIDLDNFKKLNDTLGHSTGDEVLCKVADMLKGIDEPNLIVGRLGGDEFLVVDKTEYSEERVKKIGKLIIEALSTPFKFNKFTYELKASIGSSSYPKDTKDIESLLKYADIAMYKGKEAEGSRFEIFSEEMMDQINIEVDLKRALEKGDLAVYYQPIYNVVKGKVVGAEALVRWHKEGIVIEPEKFISLAKKTGDIRDIDNFVLEEACKFCKEKIDSGCEEFQVSINASYRFLNQINFIENLKAVLNKNNLTPEALKLEITENEILEDIPGVIDILKQVKELGVKIALDDFGVGYSSFGHIKVLPIDTIKLDRSLMLKLEEDEKTLVVLKTLLALAHTLKLDVVAEGVEILEQYNLLKELECDKVQGYIIGMPADKEEFNTIQGNIELNS